MMHDDHRCKDCSREGVYSIERIMIIRSYNVWWGRRVNSNGGSKREGKHGRKGKERTLQI